MRMANDAWALGPRTTELAGDLLRMGAAVEVQELGFNGHQYDLPTWCDFMGRMRAFLEARVGG